MHNNPTLTTDNTDYTDLHGSKNLSLTIFKSASSCHPLIVGESYFCAKPEYISDTSGAKAEDVVAFAAGLKACSTPFLNTITRKKRGEARAVLCIT